MRYRVPIDLPKDALTELERRAREHDVSVDELVRNLLEDFMMERDEADQERHSRIRD